MRVLTFLIAGLLCFSLGIPSSAAAAERECVQWKVPLPWIIFYQDNGFNVFIKPEADQTNGIRGQAEYRTADGDKEYGLFEGHVTGKKIVFTVHWNNGAEGGYEGTISSQGYVDGFAYDKNVQGSNAGFKVSDLLVCAKWVAPPPPPPPPPGGTSAPQPSPDVIMHQSHEESSTRASPSTIAARCSEYAKTAVKQNNENAALGCGFAGARWESNAADHENWCRAVSPDLPASETAARADALNDCRAQIALRGQIDKKPNVPTGEVTKPVTPPPYQPLPPAGTGNLFKQMKP
jgi:hypothetical protein